MGLSTEQLQALKIVALADQIAADFIANAQDQELANWFNFNDGTFFAWRSSLRPDQSRNAIMAGATQLDDLTPGKRDALFWILSDSVDCRDATVRAALENFCGTQNTLKNSIIAATKRTCTRAEQALKIAGTGTSAAPATLGYEGFLSAGDASGVRVA
jgi:hypothetical protein